jgi:hypothetical protein
MDNQLRINLKQKSPQHPESPHEGWGEIDIILLERTNQTLLLHWEWSLEDLAAWYIDNEYAIKHETLQGIGCIPQPNESLSQAIDRAYRRDESDFRDEDTYFAWIDSLRTFNERHSLRRAMPGALIPNVVIGLNHGAGEISFTEAHATALARELWGPRYRHDWSYAFNMDDFCCHFQRQLLTYLRDWANTTDNQLALKRASTLTAKLLTITIA